MHLKPHTWTSHKKPVSTITCSHVPTCSEPPPSPPTRPARTLDPVLRVGPRVLMFTCSVPRPHVAACPCPQVHRSSSYHAATSARRATAAEAIYDTAVPTSPSPMTINSNADTSSSRFPQHWREPPRVQTRDQRRLPGGYGMGSGTLADWISQNLAKDEPIEPVKLVQPAEKQEKKKEKNARRTVRREVPGVFVRQLKHHYSIFAFLYLALPFANFTALCTLYAPW